MEARCGDAAIKSRGMDFEGLKDLYLDEKNVSNNHVGCCTNVCTSFSWGGDARHGASYPGSGRYFKVDL